MPIFDSQVHAYERNHPGRPWVGTLHGPAEVTGDQMVAAMDEVGVDGAVLVSPFSMYRYDASYACEVFAKHSTRFRLVKPVDPTDPRVTDTIADWAATKGTVGIRVFLRDTASTDPADPAINRVLAEAGRHSLPVNLACTGRLEQAAQLAARNPNTQLVIDHPGLPHPPAPPAPPQPFGNYQRCWQWPLTPTSRSRSAAPALCRTSRSRTKTSGTRSGASSTPLGSIAACGAPTGPARWRC